MFRYGLTIVIWTGLAAISSSIALADSVEFIAKNSTVEIYAQPSSKAEVVSTVKENDVLKSNGERQGMFWAVEYASGKIGYVNALKVRKKQQEGSSGLADALRKEVQKKREEDPSSDVRERSAVMGVRGLDDTSESMSAGNVKPNLGMVYKMEEMAVPKYKIESISKLVQQEVEKKMTEK